MCVPNVARICMKQGAAFFLRALAEPVYTSGGTPAVKSVTTTPGIPPTDSSFSFIDRSYTTQDVLKHVSEKREIQFAAVVTSPGKEKESLEVDFVILDADRLLNSEALFRADAGAPYGAVVLDAPFTSYTQAVATTRYLERYYTLDGVSVSATCTRRGDMYFGVLSLGDSLLFDDDVNDGRRWVLGWAVDTDSDRKVAISLGSLTGLCRTGSLGALTSNVPGLVLEVQQRARNSEAWFSMLRNSVFKASGTATDADESRFADATREARSVMFTLFQISCGNPQDHNLVASQSKNSHLREPFNTRGVQAALQCLSGVAFEDDDARLESKVGDDGSLGVFAPGKRSPAFAGTSDAEPSAEAMLSISHAAEKATAVLVNLRRALAGDRTHP